MENLGKLKDDVARFFEMTDSRLLVFILLSLNFLSFTLTSNEEAYLPLARQFMDPKWIPDSFTFSEWPGNRLIFQWFTGWMLTWLTFEQVAFAGRLLVFCLIAFPVGRLFKILGIGNLPAILILQFYLIKQNYFAGEFIFGDYEAKSLAYIMVLAGLVCLLNGKYIQSVLWALLAAYLHILVGGWFFLLVLLYTMVSTKSSRIVFRQLVLFSVLIAPFAFYLVKQVYSDGTVIQGVNIDWVYVYFRNPHHTAPLSVKAHLLRTTLQIGGTFILFLLTVFLIARVKGPVSDELRTLNIIIFSILFLSLGISLFDHNGTFLKFYPFRLAALGLLMMYLYVYKWFSVTWHCPVAVQLIIIFFGFYVTLAASFQTIRNIIHPVSRPSFEALVNYVTHHSDPSDVFVPLNDYDLSFSRRTRREVFVNFKFDPGGGGKIYEWYYRVNERKKLENQIGYLGEILKRYKLNFVLSDHPLTSYSRLKLVFNNPNYYLYKIQ
jgi:hypothetical protein